jgi:hypothetical protein
VDSNFAGDTYTRKSTSAAMGAKQGLWLRKLLSEILDMQPIPFALFVDNLAALSLIRNKSAGISGRTKHVDVQYMFVRERHERGEFEAVYVAPHLQVADIFTKPLTGQVFSGFRAAISMLSFSETGM